MRIASITRDSIVDGVGIRDVIWAQGCPHHCKSCHNSQTWNFDGGTEMSVTEIADQLTKWNNITISGGEPFAQEFELMTLVEYLSWRYPDKTIWIYTGYTFDQLNKGVLLELLEHNVEVIVDGRFEEDKKDTELRFRGSSNQRLIDLNKTLKCGKIVSWEETNE